MLFFTCFIPGNTESFLIRKFLYKSAKFKEDMFIKAKKLLKKVSPKLFIFLKNKTMKEVKQ